MKPILFNTEMVRAILDDRKTVTRRVVQPQPKGEVYQMLQGSAWPNYFGQTGSDAVFAPKYHPGDILYVRETWAEWFGGRYAYKAHCFASERYFDRTGNEIHFKWRPSIHMPKEAARIFLRVTDVRVERVQDITDAGARAEGIGDTDVVYNSGALQCKFAELWNGTIKPADRALYGWAANPWVWVIEFERISREEAVGNA